MRTELPLRVHLDFDPVQPIVCPRLQKQHPTAQAQNQCHLDTNKSGPVPDVRLLATSSAYIQFLKATE